jgi:hypothetical protein
MYTYLHEKIKKKKNTNKFPPSPALGSITETSWKNTRLGHDQPRRWAITEQLPQQPQGIKYIHTFVHLYSLYAYSVYKRRHRREREVCWPLVALALQKQKLSNGRRPRLRHMMKVWVCVYTDTHTYHTLYIIIYFFAVVSVVAPTGYYMRLYT